MSNFEESLELYDKEETAALKDALVDFKNFMGRFIADSPLAIEKLEKICVESFRLGFYSGIDFSEKFM